MATNSTTTTWHTLLLCLFLLIGGSYGYKQQCSRASRNCSDGLLIPAWLPLNSSTHLGEIVVRAIVYLLCLLYLFLGLTILSDKFMAAIEVITSQEREIVVRRQGKKEVRMTVRIWNETIANLTLIAMGSSAPEILLSTLEIFSQEFDPGNLGPGTIVGSAAYNLFIILAVSVIVLPANEVKRVKHIGAFWATVTLSTFAYIWLYLILAVISEGIVEWWEALLTFLFFPITVINAYIFNTQFAKFGTTFLRKRVAGPFGRHLSAISMRLFRSMSSSAASATNQLQMIDGNVIGGGGLVDIEQYESNRQKYLHVFQRLRKQYPEMDIHILEEMARQELLKKLPKSRAFYRVQATRKLIGQGDIMDRGASVLRRKTHPNTSISRVEKEQSTGSQVDNKQTAYVYFDRGHYTCMENVGSITVEVVCNWNGVSGPYMVLVDYKTVDDTAKHGSDFTAISGTLKFHSTMGGKKTSKKIQIQILDDDIFEEDETFSVKLSNARIKWVDEEGKPFFYGLLGLGGYSRGPLTASVELGVPSETTVVILDDDHAGVFQFETGVADVYKSSEEILLRVERAKGYRGKVSVPYHTIDGTAVADEDYVPQKGVLNFENDQTCCYISVIIIDDDDYVKAEHFYVELGQPEWEKPTEKRPQRGMLSFLRFWEVNSRKSLDEEAMRIAEEGRPVLGEPVKCTVTIKESKEFKNFFDKLYKINKTAFLVGTSSWKQQFYEAITLEALAEEEGFEKKKPKFTELMMHSISLPWKLLFATVPPTDFWNGWMCFLVSVAMLILLTALIGDLATHFGCTVGLKNSVTAISIVAVGTRLPDILACRLTAVDADLSIVNVMGSNAVNVFLGLGIAWSIASIHHSAKHTQFKVDPGSLAYSVTLFCVGSIICVAVLQFRRYLPSIGGELGGPWLWRWLTVSVLVTLWILYVLLSSLEAYCLIRPNIL